MTSLLRPALAMILGLTLLTGLAMPLAMTGIARLAFPWQAGGSLVERNGRIIGSTLIGQDFTSPRHFHGRPSATTEADPAAPGGTRPAPYNAAAGAASQLGPTSEALREAIRQRIAAATATAPGPVPADAVTASGSGLDPDISLENARRQAPGIAAARGLPVARVLALIEHEASPRALGLLGEARVNVLRLNLALDAEP
ncbi:potassium-transporting ATPase subunit KdpC [Roseicella frigidaeris]|uniref:Potassium-transporting ATPase KdpC subunit n=1 Tax=Roseicella frigidaeris TaxID=2230885 RepID=A0A327M7E7_9PROT|nr:potassium-transporting ATPase subunit KdpC [Roseicella frigidaeris]RAI58669.1 potassium-transporting ATPase subunit C [Roseicella frigidaeris]